MIEVMLSSTVEDLIEDRAAAEGVIRSFNMFEAIGAKPIVNATVSSSSIATTVEMARRCSLYVLLLGRRYGYVASGTQKSATEREFDAAVRADPTKVLVLRRGFNNYEPEQEAFINRVRDYLRGYWVSDYVSIIELQQLLTASIESWVERRMLLGGQLDIYDQFVRLALSSRPSPDAKLFYAKSEDYIELRYSVFDTVYLLHFERKQIHMDFWGCVSELQRHFERWERENYASTD